MMPFEFHSASHSFSLATAREFAASTDLYVEDKDKDKDKENVRRRKKDDDEKGEENSRTGETSFCKAGCLVTGAIWSFS